MQGVCEVGRKLSLICFLVWSIHAQTFIDNSGGLPRTYNWSTSIGDFDADGRMDLLCFNSGSESQFEPALYRFQEDRTFAKVATSFLPNRQGYVKSVWADANGDGRLDVLLGASGAANQARVTVWLQNPDRSFSEQPNEIPGQPLGWVDLDNDGQLDIVTENQIFWNDGFTFSNKTSVPFYWSPHALDWADLDNDGDLDLVLSELQSSKLFRNDGFRHFTETGVTLGRGLLADVNGDGWLDSIYNRDEGHTWKTIVQFNQGGFRFTETAVDTGWGIFQAHKAADFDGDGLPDLLLISHPRGIGFPPRIYRNKGEALFEPSPVTIPSIMEIQSATVVDMDGDADLDLVAFGPDAFIEQSRHHFRNNTPVSVSRSAPVRLRSRVIGDTVELSWDAGDAVPATFNLRMGRTPGAADVVSPASLPDGRRLIPAMGNAQASKKWRVRKLQPGIYYWAVQAVDWGWRGSPFSEEASFEVTEPTVVLPPPFISEIGAVFTDEDIRTREIPFTIGPVESELSVTIESNNPKLTPANGIDISGEGANRSIVITPALNQSGSGTLTVRVADVEGRVATRPFILTVTAVNDLPVIEEIPNQITYAGAGPLIVPLAITDAESPVWPSRLPWEPGPREPILSTNLTVKFRSSDQQLVPDSGLKLTGSKLEINPVANRTGSVFIHVTASDGASETALSFVLLILASPMQPAGPLLEGANPLWGDFNNDGRLDLILGSRLYLNSANGLVESSVSLPPNSYGGIAAFDLDRDNDLDLLQINSEAVRLLRNQGDATFVLHPPGSIPRLWFPAIVPTDVDNDGDTDLFVGGSVDGPIYTFRLFLQENGSFRSASVPISNAGLSFQTADIDHDGWLDLLFWGTLNNTATTRHGIYRGIGGGRFGPLESFPSTFEPLNPFGIEDINSDGWVDLWQLSTSGLRLYQNRAGAFELTTTLADRPLDWIDWDNDGDLDFLSRTNFVRNDGEFQFSSRLSPLAGLSGPEAWLADYDNDGAMDALLSQYNSSTRLYEGVRLYKNLSTVLNPPPAAPRNLSATADGRKVTFAWTPPEDLNQRSGFTYNVRVGTTPGGSEILSASALANGKLLFVSGGNAGGRSFLMLTNLTREIYFWSVQAIDHNFAGGPFAVEQRVLVPQPNNLPPVISDLGPVHLLENSMAEVTFTVNDDLSALPMITVRAFPSDPILLPPSKLELTTANHSEYSLKIVPATNLYGSATMRIEVTDLSGAVTIRQFEVNVANVNQAPISRKHQLKLNEDSRITFVPTTDPDGDPLTYALIQRPSRGELILEQNAYVYEPHPNAFGMDQALIEAVDPGGLRALIQVSFEIVAVPDASASSFSFQMLEGMPVFTLHAEPYAFYVIESSEDLLQWIAGEPLSSPTGEISFRPALQAPLSRFYRARRID
ncbi:MAG: FG-GAP-like repeat-containing protein [Verrucomicrobiota bacterium]